jgi:histidyl-tRNA synthetase
MGLDRVLLAMQGEGLALPPARTPRCFVVAVGDDARAAGADLLGELRSAGLPAIDALEARPLKAQLRMADRSGAEFAAIVGARELEQGVCTLRRLADGVQKTVPRADAVGWLTRLDAWTDDPR